MNIIPVNNPTPAAGNNSVNGASVSQAEHNFSDFIKSTISQVNESQVDGDQAIQKLHSGEAQNLHNVMISVEQADISLRMLVQVRNKAIQAYEEIMRMQI
ncbi:MAG: flagellar hook-basal body complex protein FliE [Desulfocapsaceae bacterium]|jgi:flagellar hook-basal body complex protein FliE|nr:flagellar hook-basal body complex protein FliE [Desulfocapsaceae bacterium]